MSGKKQSSQCIGAFALLLSCWTACRLLPGSAFAADTVVQPAAAPAKAVLLDTFYNHETKNGRPYHYTWEDTAQSGFSKLGSVFTECGARLGELAAAPTEASLREYSVYIIVDPDIESEAADHKPNFVDAAASDAVARWVEAGGTLMLMNNNKGNADFGHINILASRFGITFNEDSRNETPKRDLTRATVDTRAFAGQPFFRDVPAVYMKEVCTLGVRAPAEAVLTAPKEAGQGADVLMATSRLGKGRVVAVGDPWLYNEYIDFVPPGSSVENHKAAVNLVRWLLAAAPTSAVVAAADGAAPFMSYPAGTTPEAVGKRVADNLYSRPHMVYKNGTIHYAEACAAMGALQFAGLTRDVELLKRLVARYAPIITPEGDKQLVPNQAHVDHSVFGIVPFEIYLQTGNPAYLTLGKRLVDAQWSAPLLENGLTRETRWWIDDMWMVGALLTQANRATQEPLYAERAGLFLNAYLDKLQQPNGLFFHGPEFHFHWGRGNGWVAASLAYALQVAPESSPHYARLMSGYKKMVAGLLINQGPNGMWHQLIDHPESYEESSCTAMFTYAFITGVKRGWLDRDAYGPAAQKGWLALVKHLDDKAELTDICVGTGQNTDIQYYLDRPRKTGDFHGQAPVLWCANALLR